MDVLLVGPGMDDGTRCVKLAKLLEPEYRAEIVRRRRYQLDLPNCTLADEVADVVEAAKRHESPVILYGHSSGAVVALEALVAAPELFSKAVIYEPPSVIDAPLTGPATDRVQELVAKGRPGKAFQIFLREVVRMPAREAWLVGKIVGLTKGRLVPRQVDDMLAIDELGVRLDAYAQIKVPVVLLGGDRSPKHLTERLDALARVMPAAQRVVLRGRDHGADLAAPNEIVQVIQL
ncbi:alpha/beta hydrolase [Actinocrispum sp. NPDC049592]|uniref:alpha/beta fold hydrolase n=1 Tax=Actinocrispum sp. NPDC049592 TaxID=3154835 RepID=UPI003448A604